MTKTYNYIQEAIDTKKVITCEKYINILHRALNIISSDYLISHIRDKESWGHEFIHGDSSEDLFKVYDEHYPMDSLLEMCKQIREIKEYFETEVEKINPSIDVMDIIKDTDV